MAKLTISDLQTFVTTYVLAALQAGTFSASVTSIDEMVDKWIESIQELTGFKYIATEV